MRVYMCRDDRSCQCICEVRNIDDVLSYMNSLLIDTRGLCIYNDEGKASHIDRGDIDKLIDFLMMRKEEKDGDGEYARKLIHWWLKYHVRFEEVDEL